MPIIQVPVLGTIEFPDSMSNEEIAAVIQKQLGTEPGKQYGVGETIARGVERGITSSIRGAAQLLGGTPSTIPPKEQD
jgi:hypothetical protein